MHKQTKKRTATTQNLLKRENQYQQFCSKKYRAKISNSNFPQKSAKTNKTRKKYVSSPGNYV